MTAQFLPHDAPSASVRDCSSTPPVPGKAASSCLRLAYQREFRMASSLPPPSAADVVRREKRSQAAERDGRGDGDAARGALGSLKDPPSWVRHGKGPSAATHRQAGAALVAAFKASRVWCAFTGLMHVNLNATFTPGHRIIGRWKQRDQLLNQHQNQQFVLSLKQFRNLVLSLEPTPEANKLLRMTERHLQMFSDFFPSDAQILDYCFKRGFGTDSFLLADFVHHHFPPCAILPVPAAATVPAPAATASRFFQAWFALISGPFHLAVLRRAFGGPASVVTAGMSIGELRAQHGGNVIYFQDTESFDIVIPRDTDPVAPNTRYTEIEPYDLYTFEVQPVAAAWYVQSHPGFSLRRELAEIAQNAGFRGSVAHPEFPDVYVIEVAIPVGSDRLKAFQLAFHRMLGFDLPAPSSTLRITATPPPPEFTHDQRRTFSLLHCVADTTP
ncbi:hypothetical protein PAPYR_7903 [Paratrimastix pyriformis]|uniref:Uncharacterized protein n=1 Tax=Paratrimastix pyriformis TaxID=342808 RepID=A0ABQ8UBW6_9EUKA|nr:hypothetical protein PAPYR_7903 [Paratrimastix pyriformis]